MKFLEECAARLDAGESADAVMRALRDRYTTLTCLSSKLSLVRSLCRPSQAYLDALSEVLPTIPEDTDRRRVESLAARGGRLHSDDTDAVRAAVRSLPPRLPDNARALRITRQEARECKRAQAVQMVKKNRTRTVVDGRALLAHARSIVARPAECAGGIPELTLSLMLVTGRRECELLNGQSVLTPHAPHALLFVGQAKKRDHGVAHREERVVPCLAPATEVVECLRHLRARQRHVAASNVVTSRRYQSSLSRHMRSVSPWRETHTHVHSLRGIYTCMAHALFDWGLHTDAYVAMCILGHACLTESLVYTTFAIGRDVAAHEPHLGVGHLTPPPPSCDPAAEEGPSASSSDAPPSESSRDDS